MPKGKYNRLINFPTPFKKGKNNPNWKDGIWAKNKIRYSRIAMADYYKKRRMLVLQFYGSNPPQCKCCGEQTIQFLSIDHINGGGNKHRKEIGGSGYALYSWIIKNNFPDGFQILCHNCNQAKGYYGICPHNILSKRTN